MLLGHWIEMNAVGNAGDALKKMAELLPNSAIKVMDNGQREEVKISDIMTDDIVEVKSRRKHSDRWYYRSRTNIYR